MIVNQLKPHVSSFSEVILQAGKHGDVVKIGGKVISIFNLAELFEDEGVYLTLDDGVGINEVVLPLDAYKHYQEKQTFALGDVLVVEGRVMKTEMTVKGKSFDKKHPEETLRIAGWKVEVLKA